MEKAYTRTIFENAPSKKTPLDEGNLNKIDWGLDEIDNRVIDLSNNKVDKDTIQNYVKDWFLDETTGVITLTYVNDTQQKFDLNIEKIPVNFVLSEDGILTMTTADETVFSANIGSMIKTYTFTNTDTIKAVDGGNNSFSFDVINGSITEDKLQANYLADIKLEVAKAEGSSNSASSYANDSSLNAQLSQSYAVGTGGIIRENDDTDNAKYYYQQAKNIVGGDYVSHDEIGVTVASLDASGKVPATQLPDDLGTKDYDFLENKPSVNNVELSGNKTLKDLGINIPTADGTTITIDENNVLHGVEGEGVRTFESKEEYEQAKANGDVKQGEIIGYPENEGGLKIDSSLSATSKNPVQNKVITAEIDNLKKSVGNGKTLVANAITEKGVATETDATFSTMADNILAIESGKKSLVLPTNPDIEIKSDDSTLELSWTTPTSEVEIDHYNIYTSLTAPMSLKDMTKVGSVTVDIERPRLIETKNLDSNYITDKDNILTFNADGTFLANGTTSTDNVFVMYDSTSIIDGEYIANRTFLKDCIIRLSGCPKGGSETTYRMEIVIKHGGSSASNTNYYDIGNGINIDVKQGDYLNYGAIRILQNTTVSNLTFDYNLAVDNPFSYTLTDLTNDQTYYVAVESVDKDGYENASIWKVVDGVPYRQIWVTVGLSGKCAYSTDGVSWNNTEPPTANGIRGLTYGNEIFVCIDMAGDVRTSTDGRSWKFVKGLGSGIIFNSVCYGNDRFVTVGDNGKAYYSLDGENWIAMTGGGYVVMSIAYGKNMFIATTSTSGIVMSLKPTYTEWKGWSITNGVAQLEAICYGNEVFVSVGNAGKAYYCNGDTWIAMSGLSSGAYKCIAYGNGKFVTIRSDNGYVYVNENLVAWEKKAQISNFVANSIAYLAGRFIAVGTYGRSWYSFNGENWIAMSGLDINESYYSVTSNAH